MGEASTSIRLNPFKGCDGPEGTPVPWNPYGRILSERPIFNLDPLFHAGCYYVQDSSAMYVGNIFRKLALSEAFPGMCVLDLCAAPGGKTTDIAASLREALGGAFELTANEVIRARASVLADNVAVWGEPNITVTSVVGRWLEHSRIYSFGEGEDEKLFIGSGDLLNRNLERRVEAFVEIRTPETKEQIHEILNALRDDKEKSRTMQPDGSYLREPDGEGTSSQERPYQYFSKRRVVLDEEKPVGAEPVKRSGKTEALKTVSAQQPEPFWNKIKKFFE